MKCSKCEIVKETKGYDREWVSPRWPDTLWYHLCPRCNNKFTRLMHEKEKSMFFSFIQPERLNPEAPKGDVIV
jgi:hypothetical protein